MRCKSCDSHFPVHRGIGAFLLMEDQRDDLWEETNSQIEALAKSEPEKIRLLLESPIETMNPTDLFFRGLVLDSRRQYKGAREARDLALERSYSPEQRASMSDQMQFVRRQMVGSPGPVVDLASGMGSLLEVLLPGADQHFVATDLSPRVLMRDQAVFGEITRGRGMSYLAFDARHTPFADGSVPTMVTYLGLANVRDPGGLMKELRRVVSGELLAINLFYPERRGPNTDAIRQLKLEALMYRKSALRQFREAGFKVKVENSQNVLSRPTPKGEILEGAETDSLPVADTFVEWCTLVAS